MKACLYAICDEYLKTVKLVPGDGNGENLMRSISDYIVEHYKEKISLSDVALRLGYNYHYLSKRFNKIFHVSFTEFLNSYRLDAALELLVETELDITEVALSSGFQSVRSFNDFFKMKMGATPSEYREKTVKPTKSAVT
jgi:AraC-like DNA-binding protein